MRFIFPWSSTPVEVAAWPSGWVYDTSESIEKSRGIGKFAYWGFAGARSRSG